MSSSFSKDFQTCPGLSIKCRIIWRIAWADSYCSNVPASFTVKLPVPASKLSCGPAIAPMSVRRFALWIWHPANAVILGAARSEAVGKMHRIIGGDICDERLPTQQVCRILDHILE